MNPIEAVASFFSNYANFKGRATRSEYWWCALVAGLCYIPVVFVMAFLDIVGLLLIAAFYIAIFIPALALSVRRLHDTNRTGWWCFLYWVPFFGVIILFIFSVIPSTIGSNHYGPSPKMLKGSA